MSIAWRSYGRIAKQHHSKMFKITIEPGLMPASNLSFLLPISPRSTKLRSRTRPIFESISAIDLFQNLLRICPDSDSSYLSDMKRDCAYSSKHLQTGPKAQALTPLFGSLRSAVSFSSCSSLKSSSLQESKTKQNIRFHWFHVPAQFWST